MAANIPKYKNNADGDLRKLKLSKAKSLLRNFGVSDEEVGHAISFSAISNYPVGVARFPSCPVGK